MVRVLSAAICAGVMAFGLVGCAEPAAKPAAEKADPYPMPMGKAARPAVGQTVTTESGLSYVFTQEGMGPWPKTGDVLVIHGIGKFTDGKEFWNTRTENKPYEYKLGVDRVIKGFSEGMQQVRVGDRIVITMKPELAYGARGNRDIPPNSTLVFDYEILSIKAAPAAGAASASAAVPAAAATGK